MASSPIRRCAIYTRKSSEEGLEQDFNSLHAQREASEAFIKSQVGEGWRLIKTAYDDGGLSGATMQRPALQRLLEDIRRRRVDVVVVYKVDRLTRSLADFAKMVELFDANGVSFVAVTQQFNTTTSMGRLTLNVLLSFAQFEREVTGERIRDKIAASKRKGIWMGGVAPLGYDVRDRRLVVNRAEATTVKHIYERYIELGSVRLLKGDLERRGIVSKIRVSKNSVRSGGMQFSRGALYLMLSNPIYLGEIRHKMERHPGQHQPIVSRELWEKVQRRLCDLAATHRERPTKAPRSPLAGKLFDENGEPLYVQGAVKGVRHYRYYVSRGLVRGSLPDDQRGWRVAAPGLERAVCVAAQKILGDRAAIAEAIQELSIDASRLPSVLKAAEACIQSLQSDAEAASVLTRLVEHVGLKQNGFQVSIKLPIPSDEGRDAATSNELALARFVPMRMKRRGVEMRLIIDGDATLTARVDLPLLNATARAYRWSNDLLAGRTRSIGDIARREHLTSRHVRRVMRLAFLAPRIVETIAEGRQPADLSTIAMTQRIELPPLWSAQKQALNIR
ncbi:recombinase family protein [Candidatus Binatus sp.]|uniref:recombinase family protein n=2 Tax=Candidatus Binatus sp. TaxID=2811406 RepID=UPI003BAFFD36